MSEDNFCPHSPMPCKACWEDLWKPPLGVLAGHEDIIFCCAQWPGYNPVYRTVQTLVRFRSLRRLYEERLIRLFVNEALTLMFKEIPNGPIFPGV